MARKPARKPAPSDPPPSLFDVGPFVATAPPTVPVPVVPVPPDPVVPVVPPEPAPPPAKPANGDARHAAPADMNQTALVFLDDPIARRLAVAWTTCGGDDAKWLDAAGLSPSPEVHRHRRALIANGICRPGGVTDKLALAYIQALIAKPLARAKKKE